MEKIIKAAALALMLVPSIGATQDFDRGVAAYEADDYATAMREWRLLADQGDAVAQFLVGSMYHNGKGVQQDYTEAMRWYRLSAEQGNASAQNAIGDMYRGWGGVDMDLDFVTAHMWFNIAAANGHKDAGEMRDAVSTILSAAEISEAQNRAKVCMASGYKDCD